MRRRGWDVMLWRSWRSSGSGVRKLPSVARGNVARCAEVYTPRGLGNLSGSHPPHLRAVPAPGVIRNRTGRSSHLCKEQLVLTLPSDGAAGVMDTAPRDADAA